MKVFLWNNLLRNTNISALRDGSWIISLIYSEELSKRVDKRFCLCLFNQLLFCTYINVFTLVHLSVFEYAEIYLTLGRSHWGKAQECQKIMCFNLC